MPTTTRSPVMELSEHERNEARRPMRLAFIDALFAIMKQKGISQRQVATDLGWSTHTRFTKWGHGISEPEPDEVFEIERYLLVHPGTLSRHLGYLPLEAEKASRPTGFEAIVQADDMIPDWGKDQLISVYRGIIRALGRGRRR
jgi:transcriptional regulator with XRE-family HTH domain